MFYYFALKEISNNLVFADVILVIFASLILLWLTLYVISRTQRDENNTPDTRSGENMRFFPIPILTRQFGESNYGLFSFFVYFLSSFSSISILLYLVFVVFEGILGYSISFIDSFKILFKIFSYFFSFFLFFFLLLFIVFKILQALIFFRLFTPPTGRLSRRSSIRNFIISLKEFLFFPWSISFYVGLLIFFFFIYYPAIGAEPLSQFRDKPLDIDNNILIDKNNSISINGNFFYYTSNDEIKNDGMKIDELINYFENFLDEKTGSSIVFIPIVPFDIKGVLFDSLIELRPDIKFPGPFIDFAIGSIFGFSTDVNLEFGNVNITNLKVIINKLKQFRIWLFTSSIYDVQENSIYFEFGRSYLTDGTKSYLGDISKKTQTIKGDLSKININCYADRVGKPEYNKDLSEQRCNAVSQFLNDNINSKKKINIESNYFGEEDPLFGDEDEVLEPGSRRASLQIFTSNLNELSAGSF